jgi:hypothetical protein
MFWAVAIIAVALAWWVQTDPTERVLAIYLLGFPAFIPGCFLVPYIVFGILNYRNVGRSREGPQAKDTQIPVVSNGATPEK